MGGPGSPTAMDNGARATESGVCDALKVAERSETYQPAIPVGTSSVLRLYGAVSDRISCWQQLRAHGWRPMSVPGIRKYIKERKLPSYHQGRLVSLKKTELGAFIEAGRRGELEK